MSDTHSTLSAAEELDALYVAHNKLLEDRYDNTDEDMRSAIEVRLCALEDEIYEIEKEHPHLVKI